jgi:hypothetical protein
LESLYFSTYDYCPHKPKTIVAVNPKKFPKEELVNAIVTGFESE